MFWTCFRKATVEVFLKGIKLIIPYEKEHWGPCCFPAYCHLAGHGTQNYSNTGTPNRMGHDTHYVDTVLWLKKVERNYKAV